MIMLGSILQPGELQIIPQSIASKIEKFITENSEQYITTKAVFETYKRDQEKEVTRIGDLLKQEKEKNERVTLDHNRKCAELEELENKLKTLDKQNSQLKNDIVWHENEARSFRLQRDEAVDEKTSFQAMFTRRTSELEQLKSDYNSLNEKFKSAVEGKIEALASLDEIQSKKMELDFKEKRLDKEKELLNEQINLLTNDVTKNSKELIISKREHTSLIIDLQSRIQQKEEDVRVLLKNEANYKEQMKKQNEKIEDLNSRLTGQSEVENQLQNKYIQEIDSRTKLADMYKEMSDESNRKVEELARTAKELQKLLSEASVQYEELERKFVVNEATYEEHLQKKNETVAALKKELFDANNLIDALKREHLTETLENLSPHAAAAYNMMKKGLTLTQIYTEYASVSEQLMIKSHDNEQLQNTFKSVIEELEGKAHIIKKRNDDYAEAMETIERISRDYDQLEMDYNTAREKYGEAEREVARLSREKEKLQKTVSDLSRQVCFLLKEVEEARGGEIIMKGFAGDADGAGSGFLNSSDIISKKLVTFSDIEELHQNNQKLLNVIRDLSDEFEKSELKLRECNSEELKEKINELEGALAEKVESADRQNKIIQMMKNQIKMFQVISPATKSMGVFHAPDMKQIAVQTDSQEIESMVCLDLRKELDVSRRQLVELKGEFEISTKEHAKNERMMLESLEKSELAYKKLSQDYKKLISRAELSEEKYKSMTLNVDSLKTEITALENRCQMYTNTIGKHEQTIHSLREEAMNAMSALSRTEVLLENSKRECALLRDSEARLAVERDVLKQDKQSHAYLLSNLESIKASMDRSESEWKVKMDDKYDSSIKECSALRRRLQDEQDRYNQKISFLDQTIDTLKSRLEDEKKSSSELLNVTNSLKLDIEEKNKFIETLQEKIKNASSKSVAELELQIKSLQHKYQNTLKDIEHQQELVRVAKKDAEDFRILSDNMEKKLVSEREIHVNYQRQTDARIAELTAEAVDLRSRNEGLQKRANELAGLNETSMVNLSDELQQERHKYASMAEEFASIKQQLANTQRELKASVEGKLIAEKKYTTEMMQHTNDIKALQSKVDTILDLEHQLTTMATERDEALRRADSVNTTWRDEENRIRQEIDTQNEKMKAVVQQNELLLNQIQELSLKMAVTQRQDSVNLDQSTSAASLESSEGNMDNLLQVINFLRREKNLASSQLEVLSSENRRLKSEADLLKCQLEEANSQLKAEQDKSDISSTTATKHAELINKIQTLNALTDSNRVLREERDRFGAELVELKEKLNQIENYTIQPLRDENRRFQLQLESLQTENLALGKECAMWRNRVTEMTERMNKNNSDELKDLKKTLNKEREEYNKTLESLRSVKQEKSKLEEQAKKLVVNTAKLAQVEKERTDLQKELAAEKVKLDRIGKDFKAFQVTQEQELNKHKSSVTQLKSIARKYKNQWQELTDKNNELVTEVTRLQAVQAPIPAAEPAVAVVEVSVDEQNRLRLEGRQQVETEMNCQVLQLNDEITANLARIEALESENKQLVATVAEKDVRNTDIMHQARTRIQFLTKMDKKQKSEIENIKKQLDEHCARANVVKSRIALLEKEKLDSQTERDRLSREVDVLMQRLNTLQRQLNSQQGVKTNVNSSQEKSITEPPTANIKPMAGPSSSVTKSQQNQQSVAVTPWRSANETPLASIRPMSMQTRTAAVLPTSQTSCSASQSTIMVPPQQQLVDTSSNAPSIVEAFSSSPSSSSHSDYNMPSTSSSVHPPLRQVVVTPTQQTSHSAESTQDEAECINQELSSQTSHSNQQSSQVSQNQAAPLPNLSQIMTAPTVSQSQMPTVALVLPRIDLQNASVAGPSHILNAAEQSVVASSQTNILPLVSASNQTDSSSNAPKRGAETYYQQDNEDSNLGQVSASNQHGQQQAVVASSIETAPEQSIVIASSQQSYDKTMSEPAVASSNASSSNTVTTTQAGLKRTRDMEGESSKGGSNTETTSVQPQVKRSRRTEQVHDDLFRNDIDETSNTDMLLKYRGLDVEYQVPTSSQRDQEFDNLVIDSEAEDEPEEDEQAMPDDGIIDENDDGQEYVEDEEEVENEEVYEAEDYDREEQDTTMTSYNIMEGPDIDEVSVQVQDQDNEVEIIDEESNEVPNQSGRSDSSALLTQTRRSIDQQSSEATSSGNNMRAQSANITSNQPSVSLQFGRRPSTISPLNRQQNQQMLMSQGFEENAGDDSIVPSTPTLCVPRRTDGFGEAVSSPHVPSAARFTFSENNPAANRAGVVQMISEGIDDTRMDLSQLEENSGTGRSVPSTPVQSSPQEVERIEVGQSGEDGQPLNEEISVNTSQQQQPPEDILIDTENFRNDSVVNELEITNESENLIDEPSEPGRDEIADVTSDSGQSEPSVPGTSIVVTEDLEEGREAEAATKTSESRPPQPILTTNQTARRGVGGGRLGRSRGARSSNWGGNVQRNRSMGDQMGQETDNMGHNRRGQFRGGRKPNKWYNYNKRY